MKAAGWREAVRHHSGLHHGAIHLAASIATIALRRKCIPGQPIPITLHELSKETGMRSINTVKRYRSMLEQAGWLQSRTVFREHRQRATEYVLTDPRADVNNLTPAPPVENPEAGVNKLTPEAGVSPHAQAGVNKLTPVLRSKYRAESGHEPRSGELVPATTTPTELAAANGWPPHLIATMTPRQRLRAANTRYEDQP